MSENADDQLISKNNQVDKSFLKPANKTSIFTRIRRNATRAVGAFAAISGAVPDININNPITDSPDSMPDKAVVQSLDRQGAYTIDQRLRLPDGPGFHPVVTEISESAEVVNPWVKELTKVREKFGVDLSKFTNLGRFEGDMFADSVGGNYFMEDPNILERIDAAEWRETSLSKEELIELATARVDEFRFYARVTPKSPNWNTEREIFKQFANDFPTIVLSLPDRIDLEHLMLRGARAEEDLLTMPNPLDRSVLRDRLIGIFIHEGRHYFQKPGSMERLSKVLTKDQYIEMIGRDAEVVNQIFEAVLNLDYQNTNHVSDLINFMGMEYVGQLLGNVENVLASRFPELNTDDQIINGQVLNKLYDILNLESPYDDMRPNIYEAYIQILNHLVDLPQDQRGEKQGYMDVILSRLYFDINHMILDPYPKVPHTETPHTRDEIRLMSGINKLAASLHAQLAIYQFQRITGNDDSQTYDLVIEEYRQLYRKYSFR